MTCVHESARPRGALLPMALTLAALVALAFALRRPGEEVIVTLTKPAEAGSPLPVPRAGTVQVEGIADSKGAVYRALREQGAVVLEWFEDRPGVGRVSHGLTAAKFDPITKRFAGAITLGPSERKGTILHLEARAIDRAGRHHIGGRVPVIVE